MKDQMTPAQRCERFNQLFARVPGDTTSDKLDWLENNLHCSRKTAIIWRSPTTTRPIPAAKLRILEKQLAGLPK